MPLFYLRRLAGRERTKRANRRLAWILAFVAGATNGGGFLAVGQYTSHMTGVVEALAYHLEMNKLTLAVTAIASLGTFMLGAVATTLCVRWARRHDLESEYALPLLVEAGLLLFFGFAGHRFAGPHVLVMIAVLCFAMGLQNAIITKLSNSEIRTTHLTGMVTDIGIGLGRMLFTWVGRTGDLYSEDLVGVRRLSLIVGFFFVGGVAGAFGFQIVGFLFTLPLALTLLMVAIVPVMDDVRRKTAKTVVQ